MKKIFAAMSMMAFATMAVIVSPSVSEATPNFARQMNLPCFSCHFQNVPKLNAFGRAFKMGGYTDAAVDLIEDDGISIPATAPMAFIYKFRFQKSSPVTGAVSPAVDAGTDRGEWQIPDEAAIWMAGRGGENLGYAIEWGGPYLSGKIIWSAPVAGGRLGAVVYSTDGLGASFGMDPFNTTYASTRMLENRSQAHAMQVTGVMGGAAEGLGFYYGSGLIFANVGLFAPVFGAADGALDLSMNYRLAVTPTIAGWDTEIGIVGAAGSTKCVECTTGAAVAADGSLTEVKTEWMAVDAMAQGQIAGMNTEIQVVYANVGKVDGNAYGEGNALSAQVEVSFSPMINLALGYMTHTDKSSGSSVDSSGFTVAPIINLAQNQNLRIEYSSMSGDGRGQDNLMTVMLMGGF